MNNIILTTINKYILLELKLEHICNIIIFQKLKPILWN